MIFGIGVDIVEVPRVKRLLERYGERFAARTLAPAEWDGFRASVHPALYLAGRFAAKEAFSKAMGTGLRHPVALTRIGVSHDALAVAPDERYLQPVDAEVVGTDGHRVVPVGRAVVDGRDRHGAGGR